MRSTRFYTDFSKKFCRKKRGNADKFNISHILNLLLVAGLEPARGCPRGILSPLRLPIPPHQQLFITHVPVISLDCVNGWRWIRTTEAICSRFTVCPLWPLGNPSM